MDRREALKILGTVMSGTIVGAPAFLTGSIIGRSGPSLTGEQTALMNEIGETIIPETASSGGARAADVGNFANRIVTNFYTDDERDTLNTGFIAIEERSKNKNGKKFMDLTPEQRHKLLMDFETLAAESKDKTHSYIMIKQLVVWGWLTSGVAGTEAFDHAFIPGRFDPDVEYIPGKSKAMFPRAGEWQARNSATHHINIREES